MLLFPLSFCSYLEKFTDFLRLFVSVHLRRIESSPQFPVLEFLSQLFKYTFNQVITICKIKIQVFIHYTKNFCMQIVSSDILQAFFIILLAYPWRLFCLFGYMECLFGFSYNQDQEQTRW